MALAKAYGRATQVLTIAIGMVVPPLAGRFADDRLGTKILFTLLGAALGLAYGIWNLVKLTGPTQQKTETVDSNSDHH